MSDFGQDHERAQKLAEVRAELQPQRKTPSDTPEHFNSIRNATRTRLGQGAAADTGNPIEQLCQRESKVPEWVTEATGRKFSNEGNGDSLCANQQC